MRAIPASYVSDSCCALRFTVLLTVITALMLVTSMRAQDAASLAVTSVRPLITQTIDETRFTRLRGNTHPLARPEFDLGTAEASLPMKRMLLVLKRSLDQEHQLRKLLDDQQDKASRTITSGSRRSNTASSSAPPRATCRRSPRGCNLTDSR